MKKDILIEPRGAVNLANGEHSLPGEASFVRNLREREGALEVVGSCLQLSDLAEGERLVLADESEWGTRLITVLNGSIVWHGTLRDGVVEAVGEVLAKPDGEVVDARSCGKYVVVGTTASTMVLRRYADRYVLLDAAGVQPLIMLAATEPTATSVAVDAYTFSHTYSSWSTLDATDSAALAELWLGAIASAQSSAALSGRLCGAVAARIGVRLYDESYLWLGAPVLVGVESTADLLATTTVSVVAGSNGYSGVSGGKMSVPTYRLGITPVACFGSEWDGIVKSVDVLISDEMMLADLECGAMELRCITTSSGGVRTQSLRIGAKSADKATLGRTAASVGRWRVVSSTTDFAALRQGKWNAVGCAVSTRQLIDGRTTAALQSIGSGSATVSATDCAGVMLTAAAQMVCRCFASGCGRVFGGNVSLCHGMPWSIAHYFAGTFTAGTCKAVVEVTLLTDDGEQTLRVGTDVPFVPSGIGAMVCYPDARATHIKITFQGSGGVMAWESDLQPNADGTQAVSVSANLLTQSASATGAAQITLPESVPWSERFAGAVAYCDGGNPLVWHIDDCVSGESIEGVAVSVRPLYSGGFGRYPLFLFCSDGIYAAAQQTTGALGDARLVSRERLATGTVPCDAGDVIAFINRRGDVLQMRGSKVERMLRSTTAKALAWNDAENELWMLRADGGVDVMMESRRCYRRSEQPAWLYSHASVAMAAVGGCIADLGREVQGQMVPVQWLTHAVVVSQHMRGMLRSVVWNVFADKARLHLRVYGERGASCHGIDVGGMQVSGVLGAPLVHRLLAARLRSVRLMVEGDLLTGDLLRAPLLTIE